jgi:hypothetical protein
MFTVLKPAAADLCLVLPGMGRISLQSSAKLLDQLRVRIGSAKLAESITSRPCVAASEAIREIAWETDRQFVGTRD